MRPVKNINRMTTVSARNLVIMHIIAENLALFFILCRRVFAYHGLQEDICFHNFEYIVLQNK